MIYQLPCGKVILISVEEYLSMSDEELKHVANSGYGEYISQSTKFSGKGRKESKKIKDELDYKPDDDEPDTHGPVDLNNI
jgi:hypothetical protein